MRSCFVSLIVTGVGLLVLAGAVPAQAVPAAQEAATNEFDRRDFSGLWFNYSYRSGGPGGVRLFGPDDSHPPLTPAGMAKMSGRVSAEEADVSPPVLERKAQSGVGLNPLHRNRLARKERVVHRVDEQRGRADRR